MEALKSGEKQKRVLQEGDKGKVEVEGQVLELLYL
jgi:hypothetical protein